MYDFTLACVIVNNSVILVFDFLSRSVSGGGNGRLAFAARNNLNTAMVNCDSNTSFAMKIILTSRKVKLRFLQI